MAMFTEKYVLENIDKFDLLMKSTNHIYRFMFENEGYILKKGWLSVDNLSPFWLAIKKVFGSDFETQRRNINSVLMLLRKNPHIDVAEIVSTSDEYRYQIFKEVKGVKYGPDEFPDNREIEYQLGSYIGYLHSIQFDDYGAYPLSEHKKHSFKDEMISCMKYIIDTYWNDDKKVQDYFKHICGIEIAPASYSLIMPDISANQFVYSDDLNKINAVIDFDEYVIGPGEWELAIVELCLKNGNAFKNGYEQYIKMPDISNSRSFYRFFSYLCDPWERVDLNTFMTNNIVF